MSKCPECNREMTIGFEGLLHCVYCRATWKTVCARCMSEHHLEHSPDCPRPRTQSYGVISSAPQPFWEKILFLMASVVAAIAVALIVWNR